MIARPTPRQLEALAMLEHDNHFKDVMQLLRDSLDETISRCISETDEVALRQAQGAARDLRELIDMAGTARTTAEQLRRQTP